MTTSLVSLASFCAIGVLNAVLGLVLLVGLHQLVFVSGADLIANYCVLRLIVQQFHVWYVSATVCLAAVSAPMSFAVHRLITYRVGQQP